MSLFDEETLRALMIGAQNGDKDDYRDLLKSLRPYLSAYFQRRLRGDRGEDLVQVTLMAIHLHRHTYDPHKAFGPWLHAVARHKLIDEVRKNKGRVYVDLDDNLPMEGSSHDNLYAQDLKAMLAHLSPDQSQMIKLHKIEQFSLEDIAHMTGKSVSNIKVLVHRALKSMRQKALNQDKTND